MAYSIDTRTLQPGDIFIPVKGERFDGHDYIQEALNKGASKILDKNLSDVAKAYRKKLRCDVIGIVGSFGKTTTKDYLKAALSVQYNVVATQQNKNNTIGVALTLLEATYETDILIIEMGIRKPGDMKHLMQMVRPNIVVFTGIGISHIEFFNSPSALCKEKCQIFSKPLTWEKTRSAFICDQGKKSNPIVKKAESKGFNCFFYSNKNHQHPAFDLSFKLASFFNISDEKISDGLKQYKASNHRLNIKNINNITIVDDSYNANPDGLVYALNYFQKFPGRKICVLGPMKELGTFSHQAHKDILKLTDDLSIPLSIIIGLEYPKEALHAKCMPMQTKQEARTYLIQELKPGDCLLIKASRSCQFETIVNYLESNLC